MIKLIWKAIKRDVDRVTFASAKVHIAGGDPEVVDTVQTDDSPTSERTVLRWAEEGVAALIGLSKGTWKRKAESPLPATSNDDLLHHGIKEWLFEPSAHKSHGGCGGHHWSHERVVGVSSDDDRTLAILMHQFVVAYILWQWSLACMPMLVKQMEGKYAASELALKNAMYEQAMPVKQILYNTDMEQVEITID